MRLAARRRSVAPGTRWGALLLALMVAAAGLAPGLVLARMLGPAGLGAGDVCWTSDATTRGQSDPGAPSQHGVGAHAHCAECVVGASSWGPAAQPMGLLHAPAQGLLRTLPERDGVYGSERRWRLALPRAPPPARLLWMSRSRGLGVRPH